MKLTNIIEESFHELEEFQFQASDTEKGMLKGGLLAGGLAALLGTPEAAEATHNALSHAAGNIQDFYHHIRGDEVLQQQLDQHQHLTQVAQNPQNYVDFNKLGPNDLAKHLGNGWEARDGYVINPNTHEVFINGKKIPFNQALNYIQPDKFAQVLGNGWEANDGNIVNLNQGVEITKNQGLTNMSTLDKLKSEFITPDNIAKGAMYGTGAIGLAGLGKYAYDKSKQKTKTKTKTSPSTKPTGPSTRPVGGLGGLGGTKPTGPSTKPTGPSTRPVGGLNILGGLSSLGSTKPPSTSTKSTSDILTNFYRNKYK